MLEFCPLAQAIGDNSNNNKTNDNNPQVHPRRGMDNGRRGKDNNHSSNNNNGSSIRSSRSNDNNNSSNQDSLRKEQEKASRVSATNVGWLVTVHETVVQLLKLIWERRVNQARILKYK